MGKEVDEMKFRWTMKELKESKDLEILRGLVAERRSTLNAYSPLSEKLDKIYINLQKQIDKEREK